jgi:hypothetical protein
MAGSGQPPGGPVGWGTSRRGRCAWSEAAGRPAPRRRAGLRRRKRKHRSVSYCGRAGSVQRVHSAVARLLMSPRPWPARLLLGYSSHVPVIQFLRRGGRVPPGPPAAAVKRCACAASRECPAAPTAGGPWMPATPASATTRSIHRLDNRRGCLFNCRF